VFNLAGALADLGRRVLCVDLDAQANLTASFGYDADALDLTSEDLLTNEKTTAEDVILETAVEGVHLVPADIRLCQADVKIHEMLLRETILAGKLKHLFRWYHVVLFDCPPNLSKVTVNGLLASEEVVVPVETQSYSIKALGDLTNTFAVLRQRMSHVLRMWVLPTKVNLAAPYAREFLDALREAFGERLLPFVGADPDVVKAPMTFEPLTRSFPGSNAARAYASLARFLVLPDAERDNAARAQDARGR
jgi:chromosome partitioning protein